MRIMKKFNSYITPDIEICNTCYLGAFCISGGEFTPTEITTYDPDSD